MTSEATATRKRLYTNNEVAKMCGCSPVTVRMWALNHDIYYVGTDRRKVYVWFEDDIEAFKNRPAPGRPASK
jgi:uncharacterized protein YjcR